MGIARKLEQRLEQMIDGLSSALFRGSVGPLELAGKLVRQADLQVYDGEHGPAIPNAFTVRVSPKDVDATEALEHLEAVLERALEHEAQERGWRTDGPLQAHVVVDDDLASGAVQCHAAPRPGPRPPWGQLIDLSGQTVHGLSDNRVTLGRSSRADVVLEPAEVSRMHALVMRRSGGFWVTDLDSSNGTSVNDVPVGATPHGIAPGDQLRVGPLRFIFRVL